MREKFSEFLERKNNEIAAKPKKEKVASYSGEQSKAPKKDKKSKGEPSPYKSGKDIKPDNSELENGLANKGDKKLVSKSDDNCHDDHVNGVNGGKQKPTFPKTKIQEWLEKTKNLSTTDFLKSAKNEGLNSKSLDNIKETIDICKKDTTQIANLLREAKRQDVLEKFVLEILKLSETNKILTNIVSDKELLESTILSKKSGVEAIQSILEMISPPIGMNSQQPTKFSSQETEDEEYPEEGEEDSESEESEESEDFDGSEEDEEDSFETDEEENDDESMQGDESGSLEDDTPNYKNPPIHDRLPSFYKR